jgi:hypothetical protein
MKHTQIHSEKHASTHTLPAVSIEPLDPLGVMDTASSSLGLSVMTSKNACKPGREAVKCKETARNVGAACIAPQTFGRVAAIFMICLGLGACSNSDPKDALAYVLDKKWTLENLPCDLNGGVYQIFSRSTPAGYVFHAGGRPQLGEARSSSRFETKAPNQFVLEQHFYANDLVSRSLSNSNALSASTIWIVTLTSPTRIDYVKRIQQLNFQAMLGGVQAYDINVETGYGLLCK